MAGKNASAAIVGAGDYIGAAIAKKFAAEGFTIFAGRRNGDKLAPLVQEVEGRGRQDFRSLARCAQRGRDRRVHSRCRSARSAGGVHFQYRRQRQFPADRDDRARLPQMWAMACYAGFLTDTRGGENSARARPRQPSFCTGATASPPRRHRLCRVCQRQIRLARGGAGGGARTRTEKHYVAHPIIDPGVDTQWVRERIKQPTRAERRRSPIWMPSG